MKVVFISYNPPPDACLINHHLQKSQYDVSRLAPVGSLIQKPEAKPWRTWRFNPQPVTHPILASLEVEI